MLLLFARPMFVSGMDPTLNGFEGPPWMVVLICFTFDFTAALSKPVLRHLFSNALALLSENLGFLGFFLWREWSMLVSCSAWNLE